MEITPEVIAVMQQIERSHVYRTREGGSDQYLANKAIVNALLKAGYASSFGRCRRDYFLTPAGEKILEEHANV